MSGKIREAFHKIELGRQRRNDKIQRTNPAVLTSKKKGREAKE